MSTRYHLRCSTLFHASAEEVWALKTDPEKIQDEFQPLFHADTTSAQEALAALKRGELPVSYTIQMKGAGILPLGKWPVEVVEYENQSHYVDRSENNVFGYWRHEHRLQSSSIGTQYTDLVDFEPRSKARWTALALRELFLYRHRRAARHLPTQPRATAIATLRELSGSPI